MRRRVMNLLTLVSAVVCVGSALLVGRSFWWADILRVPTGEASGWVLGTVDARLEVSYVEFPLKLEYLSVRSIFIVANQDQYWKQLTGVRWLRLGWGSPVGVVTVLILPLWLAPILTAILPVRWWVRRRREGGRGFEVEKTVPTNLTNLHEESQ
jgi:hypothetical protein